MLPPDRRHRLAVFFGLRTAFPTFLAVLTRPNGATSAALLMANFPDQ